MSPRAPLPARILIPVANPATAEDLVRIGAEIMDPRAGELTALGIVEVPEDVALSEGATQARQARRLLQKVLDYAPAGDADPAAGPDRPPGRGGDRRGGPRGGRRPPHLRLGRPARRPQRRAGPRLLGDDRRRRPRRRRATSPSSSSAPFGEVRRILVPGPRRSPRRARPRVRRRPRPPPRRPDRRPPRDPAGRHAPASGPRRSTRSRRSCRQHARGHADGLLREAPNVRNAILREAEKADLVIMGASAAPGGTAADAFLFGALPEAIAARATPPVIVVKTRERIGQATFEELAAPGGVARRRRPGGRGVAGRAGARGAMVRRVQLPPRRVPQPAPARGAEGAAGAYRQPRPTDAQRGGDDRRDRGPRPARPRRRRAARRRAPGHRLGVDRPDPRDRRGRRGARRPALRTCCPATAPTGARARPSGRASSRRAATSSPGATPTSGTGTPGWRTARSARSSPSRGSST